MASIVSQTSKKALGFFILTLFIFSSFLVNNQNAEAQPDLFENGSFETGDLTGWAVVVQGPNNGGNWFVYSGNLSPFTIMPILSPPDGTFAATTDQEEPSSQVLFQDIEVPVQGTMECSVIVYYDNRAGVFINGPNLSTQGAENQQARIDIMDPNAPDFDIGAGVLENLFQTNPGDPLILSYTTVNFDLTDFAGTTVRFRAAEVDNIGGFLFSIDNVTCEAAPDVQVEVPTLSEWGLIAMASILGIVGFMVMRRKKVTA